MKLAAIQSSFRGECVYFFALMFEAELPPCICFVPSLACHQPHNSLLHPQTVCTPVAPDTQQTRTPRSLKRRYCMIVAAESCCCDAPVARVNNHAPGVSSINCVTRNVLMVASLGHESVTHQLNDDPDANIIHRPPYHLAIRWRFDVLCVSRTVRTRS